MKRIVAAALLALVSWTTSAKAIDSGLDLYRECAGDVIGRIQCGAFIGGFLQAMLVVQKISPQTMPRVCMPAYSSLGDGFILWAEAHPKELGREPGEAFAAALYDPSFCEQSNGGLKILR